MAKLIRLPGHFAENGSLVYMESPIIVPFAISRVFSIRAPLNAIRGAHAHKRCTQMLTCSYGRVNVICDNGKEIKNFYLDSPDIALVICPKVWATQTYMVHDSVLTVLCDRPYEENDYIRDYDEFIRYQRVIKN